ncbi:hypothetical protein MUK42_32398 [Musa troglodytarum]|uniref:TFIIB-type domain-containing protein n=1 Tax=Musa troglodytarum TaxID=320322 RepID=A0A9E7FPM4_9LILI|nr:hypothetical protein MUK42_32398 [Musa troglodytarum]
MAICSGCGGRKVIVDPDSGESVCRSCGRVLSTEKYRHEAFTSEGQPTSFLHFTGGDFGYRERKLHRARAVVADVTARLGLSAARAAEAAALASDVTDGALGEGQWFPVLVAACSYLVARRHRLPLSLSEAAAAVGHDACDLGRMAARAARHLGLPPLPEFDAAGVLDRMVRTCRCFSGVEPEKSKELIGQGRFLLHCATKWFLTTGRQPLPMVAAVLAFVAEVNGVGVSVEEIAKEVYAGVTTSKLRLKELMETLVRVARSLLPWGKDVTVKNLVQNAPLLIRLMERKSKSALSEGPGFGFGGLGLYGLYQDGEAEDSKYFEIDGEEDGNANCNIPEDVNLSGECISSAYKNVLQRISHLKEIGEFDKVQAKKARKDQLDTGALQDSWEGRWDSEKKLTLEQMLERDVGYDALPPSFVTGVQARRYRKAKIEAAKHRIHKIMKPSSSVDAVFKVEDCVPGEEVVGRKRRSRKKLQVDSLDWEDCIIELLLLHQVNEDEIEQGQYNRLLDLHVFCS